VPYRSSESNGTEDIGRARLREIRGWTSTMWRIRMQRNGSACTTRNVDVKGF
jgi:hypothetical protein